MKLKQYTGPRPECRCIKCRASFTQPWLNYVFLDCPACRRDAGLPIVSASAAPYAPPEVIRDQQRRERA